MAWIYLAELEDSPSFYTIGSGQSPIVKVIDTPSQFFCHVCQKEDCPSHPFGTTYALFAERIFPWDWTSSTADSRARTSVLQDMEKAWKESGVDYFSKSYDYVASFDQDSFSWKMSQLSLFEGLIEFSWSSLRWGTIVDGRLYQPQRLEPHTYANAGSYLPTPMATDYGTRNKNGISKPSLNTMARKNLWPTPKANDAEKGGNFDINNSRNGLPAAVKRWSTPCARDWKDNGKSQSSFTRNSQTLLTQAGGKLNPQWVEWLMGYTIDHTALKDWAMLLFRSKRKRRSKD